MTGPALTCPIEAAREALALLQSGRANDARFWLERIPRLIEIRLEEVARERRNVTAAAGPARQREARR
jgi:hypothetical protein